MLINHTKFVDEALHIFETFCSRGKEVQSCDIRVHVFCQNILILVDILFKNLELGFYLVQSSNILRSLANLITVFENVNEEKNFTSEQLDGIGGRDKTCANS